MALSRKVAVQTCTSAMVLGLALSFAWSFSGLPLWAQLFGKILSSLYAGCVMGRVLCINEWGA